MSKYGAFSGPYFLVGLNIGEYEPEKTQYLDTFHRVEPKGKAMFYIK